MAQEAACFVIRVQMIEDSWEPVATIVADVSVLVQHYARTANDDDFIAGEV